MFDINETFILHTIEDPTRPGTLLPDRTRDHELQVPAWQHLFPSGAGGQPKQLVRLLVKAHGWMVMSRKMTPLEHIQRYVKRPTLALKTAGVCAARTGCVLPILTLVDCPHCLGAGTVSSNSLSHPDAKLVCGVCHMGKIVMCACGHRIEHHILCVRTDPETWEVRPHGTTTAP